MVHLIIIPFALLMVSGLVGVFVPLLPGIPLMLLIAFSYELIDKFKHLSATELAVLSLLALLSVVVDHASGLIGARFGNASKKALLLGLLGFVLGFLFFPPLGGIAGLFVSVWIAEMVQFKDHEKAFRAAKGSLIGTLAGMLINALIGILFISLFIIFAR